MDNRLHKVYSNDSKKSRLKRKKNKFYREWDAETQTYIKKRKAKYPTKSISTVQSNTSEKKCSTEAEMKKIIARRKRMSIAKTAKAKTAYKKKVDFAMPKKAPIKQKNYTKIGGVLMEWVQEELKYRKVA